MKINWKVRLKNKAFLLTFIPMILAFIYQICAVFGITPKVAQGEVEAIILAFINLLAMLGIVVDPTTKSVSDSDKALTYKEPK